MNLPKKLWYVKVKYGEGSKLRHYEKGGGLYSNERFARERVDWLTTRGVVSTLYEAEVTWNTADGPVELLPGSEPFDEFKEN